MKIAIVYQYYADHSAPGHALIYELSQYLVDRGHEVTVISGETGYMHPSQPSLPWYRRLIRREEINGVTVLRAFSCTGIHRSYAARLLSFISFSISSALALLSMPRPDIIVASSPPIFPMISTLVTARLRKLPFVLEVRDLWPASAVEMGILHNRFLIAIMMWMERRLYSSANKIIALTQGIRDDICKRGWPSGKVETITCGVDIATLFPDRELGETLRRKLGWQNKKVILYFGALGEANNIPVILRAARRTQSHPDLLWVLVGDGMNKSVISRDIEHTSATNVLLLGAVPKSDARAYINAADICLVTLMDIVLFDGAIPTKLIDYMACGKRVVAGLRGEAKQILEEASAGRTFAPNDDEQLAKLVLEMLDEAVDKDAAEQRSVAYVRENFSAGASQQRWEILLQTVLSSHHLS
jgi:glycosyltransferase involved in cell wall biosynthesis